MMRQLIATLRDLPGASVDFAELDHPGVVRADCHLPNLPDVTVCFSGSDQVLEWYLIIKDGRTNKELWSDWMDYTGYGETDMGKLAADMTTDLQFVLDDLRKATDFRTYKTRVFWLFTERKAEWLIGGQWRDVRLYGDR